jgi:hypothetical protein
VEELQRVVVALEAPERLCEHDVPRCYECHPPAGDECTCDTAYLCFHEKEAEGQS